MSPAADRIRAWRPRTPPLPAHLAEMVGPDDPDWFARELADRPAHVDPTRPTTAAAAFPGGVVPGDIPA